MAKAAPVDITTYANGGSLIVSYDPGAGGDPYGIGNGGDTGTGSGIVTVGDAGGSSSSGDRSSGGSRVTDRTGDTSLGTVGNSDQVTPGDSANAVTSIIGGMPLNYLFNLIGQRALLPSAVALPPDTTAAGGSGLNIKTIVIIALIGGLIYAAYRYTKQ